MKERWKKSARKVIVMIVVINFGAQYAHLIARCVRELGVYSEIVSPDISVEELRQLSPSGIIFSGGPSSVYEPGAPTMDPKILELGIPILGICYGHQLIGHLSGGRVIPGGMKEYGKNAIRVTSQGTLLKGLQPVEQVWMSHGDLVESLPPAFSALTSTDSCSIASFENPAKKLYGLQFHPEVAHTPSGKRIFSNFVFDVCKADKDWKVEDLAGKLVEGVTKQVGESNVIMAVSGGVDSTVASFLIHRAIGERLHCVFVDNGLLRKGEVEEVSNMFRAHGFQNFHITDASDIFLERLSGLSDPEQKRKVIGHAFIEVFEQKAAELSKEHTIEFLGQGTIYPDRVETAATSKHASRIKSHHNVTLPENMRLKLVEPLKEFYKDEVRQLGKQLGIPEAVLRRHPFPGPGLAVRCLGEVTKEKLEILREADAIFIEELKRNGWYDKTWQAFAALLPVKAVGVKGDARSYDYVIALRAVTSRDAMTADWAKLPQELLESASSKILNGVKGVGRVLYDVSQKPPATIEFE